MINVQCILIKVIFDELSGCENLPLSITANILSNEIYATHFSK